MQPGDRIDDRFEIQLLAGEGGMGRVYRALDHRTGETVALKLLAGADAAGAERFDQEARLLAALEHPRIVRYVAHGRALSGEPFLAMEWLTGESLAERLLREGLRLEDSLAIARGVAEALAFAHARGVIHRDIKPSNLFLCSGDPARVKVLDLGIARVLGASRAFTQTGVVMGTPGYMAPEQVRSERGADARTDVFSLGAVLFECITGRPAFEGTHLMALFARLLLEEAPHLASVRADVPPELDDLVARMLRKDPDARPADGTTLLAELSTLGGAEGEGPAREPSAHSAITGNEQRLLSVVAAAPREPDSPRTPLPLAPTLASDPWSAHLSAIRAATLPLGGRVESLADGSLLLLFAGSSSATDQVARAARAALRLRAIVPGVRITLVTGRGEATGKLPVGEILDRAARMVDPTEVTGEEDADPAVRIDETTHALLDARFDVAIACGERLLLGEREVGEEARTLLGKPSPCVGRDRELRMLRDQLAASYDDGEGARVILVTGPAGVGKSRLRFELLREVKKARPEVAVAIGRADSMSAGSPFSLLGSALRGAAGIKTGEPSETQREKLYALCSRLPAGERAQVAAFLGELMGTPLPDDGDMRLRAARQSAALMADQIENAFLRFMMAACKEEPVLVVLEDLHWGDAASIKLLDYALRALEDEPVVVIALARPEVHAVFPGLWAGRDLQEIRLGALPRRAAELLLRHTLGGALPEVEVGRLLEHAAGNAFYLEELLRAVAEGRGDSMPETVLGMVEARLSGLPAEARRLLRAASVFGETFWEGGARALMGASSTVGTGDVIEALLEGELIMRRPASRFAGENEFSFRHALLREGSYAMLTERDRTLGHRLAAEWLIAANEHDPKVIGAHLERGGEPARAVAFYLRAAEQALLGNDDALVVSLVDRALSLGAEGDMALSLRALDTECAAYSGDIARGIASGREALRLAEPGSPHACRTLGSLLILGYIGRSPEVFQSALQHLVSMDPTVDALPAFARGCVLAIMTLGAQGLREATEACLHRLEMACAGTAEPAALGCLELSRGYWYRFAEGDPSLALSHIQAAQAHFEAIGDERFRIGCGAQGGYELWLLGAFDRAEQPLRVAAERLQGALEHLLAIYLARLLLDLGALDEVDAIARRTMDSGYAGYACALTASVHLARGELAEAEHILEAPAWPLLQTSAQAFWLREAQVELRLRQGRFEEALKLAEDALARHAAIRMFHAYPRPFFLCARAEALAALGRTEAAREAFREARRDVLTRAATITDPGYRRMFLESSLVNARILAGARVALGD